MAGIDVQLQVVFLICPVWTEGTYIRLFSCMDTHVSPEVGPVNGFATNWTRSI